MIVNNVKLVLDDQVVQGSLEMQDGVIRSFADGPSRLPQALDGDGGWLLPGLIELHTDNLDKFFTPRPNVDWPAHSAMSSHDALMVANGIGRLPRRIETVSNAFGRTFTRSTDAVWIISNGVVANDLAEGQLAALAVDTRITLGPVGISTRAAEAHTPDLLLFMAVMREAVEQRGLGRG